MIPETLLIQVSPSRSAPSSRGGYFRPNPIGEDVYLGVDGVTVTRDEDKIIKVQRIFKNNYYKPGGKGALRVLKRLREAN
jgi:hypothetical protein